MLPDPLHPAVVHFPIVLAVFFPVVAGVVTYLSLRKGHSRGMWIGVTVYALVLGGSGRVAISTGEDQEDAVEEIVGEDPVEQHEERAELFGVISLLSIVIAAAGLMGGKPGMAGRVGTLLVSLFLAIQVLWVGKTGGELVYEHGAAGAYVDAGVPGAPGTLPAAEREEHDDDD